VALCTDGEEPNSSTTVNKVTAGMVEMVKGFNTIITALPLNSTTQEALQKIVVTALPTPGRKRVRTMLQAVRTSPRKKAHIASPMLIEEKAKEVVEAAVGTEVEQEPTGLDILVAAAADAAETANMAAAAEAAAAEAVATEAAATEAAATEAAATEASATATATATATAAAEAAAAEAVMVEEEKESNSKTVRFQESASDKSYESVVNVSSGSSVQMLNSTPVPPVIMVNAATTHINKNIGMIIKKVVESHRWYDPDLTLRSLLLPEVQPTPEDLQRLRKRQVDLLAHELAEEIISMVPSTSSKMPSPIRRAGTVELLIAYFFYCIRIRLNSYDGG